MGMPLHLTVEVSTSHHQNQCLHEPAWKISKTLSVDFSLNLTQNARNVLHGLLQEPGVNAWWHTHPLSSPNRLTVPHYLLWMQLWHHKTVAPFRSQGDSGFGVTSSVLCSLSAPPSTILAMLSSYIFSCPQDLWKPSFRFPFPNSHTLATCPSHYIAQVNVTLTGNTLITPCVGGIVTLWEKEAVGPPGTCLRERCCLPSDQSSEHLTNSSGVFQSRSTQLIYIKKKKKEKKEHSVKPDPKWQVLWIILFGK